MTALAVCHTLVDREMNLVNIHYDPANKGKAYGDESPESPKSPTGRARS